MSATPGCAVGSSRRAPVEAPATHGWTDHAACRTATPAEADALTEVSTLVEAAPLVARWCAGCPVKALCEAQGRSTRSSGVWGGQLLRLGREPREVYVEHRRRHPRVIPLVVAEPSAAKRSVKGRQPSDPKTTKAEREGIRLHLSRGLSMRATARTVGVSDSTVRAVVQREGLDPPGVRVRRSA